MDCATGVHMTRNGGYINGSEVRRIENSVMSRETRANVK